LPRGSQNLPRNGSEVSDGRRKRQRTAALQDLAECRTGTAIHGATWNYYAQRCARSWSVAVLCRSFVPCPEAFLSPIRPSYVAACKKDQYFASGLVFGQGDLPAINLGTCYFCDIGRGLGFCCLGFGVWDFCRDLTWRPPNRGGRGGGRGRGTNYISAPSLPPALARGSRCHHARGRAPPCARSACPDRRRLCPFPWYWRGQ
jgi:hypothetical protein